MDKERGIFVPGILLSKKGQPVDTCITLEELTDIMLIGGKANIKDL